MAVSFIQTMRQEMDNPQPAPIEQEQPFWSHEVLAIPFCQQLQTQYSQIWLELTELVLSQKPFHAFPDYGLYTKGWEAFPLSLYEGEFNDNITSPGKIDMGALGQKLRRHLPVLTGLIDDLEVAGHLRNVFVSRLRPGAAIRPHRGWTSAFLRIHLGLQCDPACRITVGHETRTWESGSLLAFKDGGPYMHSVEHQGARDRVVLSADLRLTYVQRFIPNICTAPPIAPSEPR